MTTLVKLLELGEVREADELRTRMKVSDKRYWRIKIRGLAAAGSFEELNAFAIATWTPKWRILERMKWFGNGLIYIYK